MAEDLHQPHWLPPLIRQISGGLPSFEVKAWHQDLTAAIQERSLKEDLSHIYLRFLKGMLEHKVLPLVKLGGIKTTISSIIALHSRSLAGEHINSSKWKAAIEFAELITSATWPVAQQKTHKGAWAEAAQAKVETEATLAASQAAQTAHFSVWAQEVGAETAYGWATLQGEAIAYAVYYAAQAISNAAAANAKAGILAVENLNILTAITRSMTPEQLAVSLAERAFSQWMASYLLALISGGNHNVSRS